MRVYALVPSSFLKCRKFITYIYVFRQEILQNPARKYRRMQKKDRAIIHLWIIDRNREFTAYEMRQLDIVVREFPEKTSDLYLRMTQIRYDAHEIIYDISPFPYYANCIQTVHTLNRALIENLIKKYRGTIEVVN